MIEVITFTPAYVWPLLAFLIWGGWKARKVHIASWKALLVMPAVMFAWSIYANVSGHGQVSILLWVISMSIGIGLGLLTVRKLNLKFDKEKNLIEITGNWTPMILSLSIFGLRYFLGATYGFYPELKGSISLLLLENVATVVSGMFIGRLLGYWNRSKTSPHVQLSQV